MKYKTDTVRIYLQPAFLLCVAALAAGGIGSSLAASRLGLSLQKEPLPLKKSLDLLDNNSLAPYKIESQNKLIIENPEIVKSLGTQQYILWIMEDNRSTKSPAGKFTLFITYYGSADKVPHVPEECYAGSGYEQLSSDSVTLTIDNNGGFQRNIPAKYLVFADKNAIPGSGKGQFPVIYFFRVNNSYSSGREHTRIALNRSIFQKYSYFSKVELAFNCSKKAPDKEQAIKAAENLMSVILPLLEDEYWPN
jgi:hypothetical protein